MMDTVLEAKGLSKSYGGKAVVANVSLRLYRGEAVALLGLSGSGKTTLFNMLSGLEAPDSGRVYLKGEDVTGRSGLVSYMQQNDLLMPFKTIADNAALPLVLRGEKRKAAREKVKSMLGDFGLEGCGGMYPAQLSGGMRQRAALLRSCLFSSDALLMDEPFSALDAITRGDMQRWFKSLCRRRGLSVFLITHDVNEALLLSDRIYILGGTPGSITHEIKTSLPPFDEPELKAEFLNEKIRITRLIKERVDQNA